MCNKTIGSVLKSKLAGYGLFVILLIAANFFVSYYDNPDYAMGVAFVNSNFVFITAMSIVFLIAELFNVLMFPFSIPAPFFFATGAVMIYTFLIRVFGFIDSITSQNLQAIFSSASFLVYPLLFAIVFLCSMIAIFVRLIFPCRREVKRKKKPMHSWEDVGEEFKEMLYEAFSSARKSIKKKR